MKSQREIVYEVVREWVGDSYHEFIDYPSYFLHHKEDGEQIVDMVTNRMKDHPVTTSFPDLKKYVRGMVNNHMRKDVRLNGGHGYEYSIPHKIQISLEVYEAKRLIELIETDKTLGSLREQIEYMMGYDYEE